MQQYMHQPVVQHRLERSTKIFGRFRGLTGSISIVPGGPGKPSAPGRPARPGGP